MRVTLVIPVFNEERQIASSLRRVVAMTHALPEWTWHLVVADNGSTDGTWQHAQDLRRTLAISAVRLNHPGRGAALRSVWLSSEDDILAYMDVDLSTHLRHVPELLAPLKRGDADVVVGSRLAPGATIVRSWDREVLSRGFNFLARRITGSRLLDHQCGFKALHRAVAQALLPRVRNSQWFFDTELLVLAQREGWRVHELPVDWVDDPDSRVRRWATIIDHLRGLLRLRRRPCSNRSIRDPTHR